MKTMWQTRALKVRANQKAHIIMLSTSLYIHFPWCLKKCPYCDFNSVPMQEDLRDLYLERLVQELAARSKTILERNLTSIFFGGGTPSLFGPKAIATIINAAAAVFAFAPEIEISLEANPGTIDAAKWCEYKTAGINRISLGVQSFNPDKLKLLGRIHDRAAALTAIASLQPAGITNFNLDLMYGLPEQTLQEALDDLQTAINFAPQHISWYQLTLEPGTPFAEQNIVLPELDLIWEMQQQGEKLLAAAGYEHYEVSAFAKPNFRCWHNLNYWQFGDYLGIGAGAHSKITHANQVVSRIWNYAEPEKYMDVANNFAAGEKAISLKELPFEFMLNALRLYQPISYQLFTERTGLAIDVIKTELAKAVSEGFLILQPDGYLQVTNLGHLFLNDLLEIFL